MEWDDGKRKGDREKKKIDRDKYKIKRESEKKANMYIQRGEKER